MVDWSGAWSIGKDAPFIVQVRAERVSCRWRQGMKGTDV